MTIDEIKTKLKKLDEDPGMLTTDSYSPAAVDWPGNRIPFVEFHMLYISSHKLVNPIHYLSNLELMIKKR